MIYDPQQPLAPNGGWFDIERANFVPPIESWFTDGGPIHSIDVLIIVRDETGEHFALTGWYSFVHRHWEFYGFAFDQTTLTPLRWSYLPAMPDEFIKKEQPE